MKVQLKNLTCDFITILLVILYIFSIKMNTYSGKVDRDERNSRKSINGESHKNKIKVIEEKMLFTANTGRGGVGSILFDERNQT